MIKCFGFVLSVFLGIVNLGLCLNIKSANNPNIMLGITPTTVYFSTAPASLGNITDGDFSSTATVGISSGTLTSDSKIMGGYVFDQGYVRQGLYYAYFKAYDNTFSTVTINCYIQGSDNNTTYTNYVSTYSFNKANAISCKNTTGISDLYFSSAQFLKNRYIRVLFYMPVTPTIPNAYIYFYEFLGYEFP